MGKIPKKPAKPEEIQVIYHPEDYVPTPVEREAINILKQEVFTHGNEAGVHYDTLGIVNEGDKCFFFGTAPDTKGKLIFVANIRTLLGVIHDQVDLEGVIKHEAGHILEDNFLAKAKLAATVDILHHLARIHDALGSQPVVAERSIREQFGSMEAFSGTVARFERDVIPVIRAIEDNTGMFIASPETFARLMENKEACYVQLKQDLQKLPGFKELQKLRGRTEAVGNGCMPGWYGSPGAMQATTAQPSLHPGLLRADLSARLQAITDDRVTERALRAFTVNFHLAEEYAVDGHAQKYSKNPDSLAHFLKWTREWEIKCHSYALTPETLMDGELDSHPSDNQRIARMRYVTEHGKPPPEDDIKPLLKRAVAKKACEFSLDGKKGADGKPTFLDSILSGEKASADKNGKKR